MKLKPVPVYPLLDSLFETIPVFDNNNKLFFGSGDQKELNAVLTTRQVNGQPCYPILWMMPLDNMVADNFNSEGVVDFVLAHNTELDWFNDQRYTNVFEAILYPHFSLVMQALMRANGITVFDIEGNKKYRYSEYPNYGVPESFEGKDKTKQVDFWDAIKFSVRLNIKSTACNFDTIQYDLNI